MKNLRKIFALLLLTLFVMSCTPNSLNDDSDTTENTIQATGGDGGSSTDDDKGDGNG